MQNSQCSMLFVSASMAHSDRQALLAVIGAHMDLHPINRREMNPEWEVFTTVVKDIGSIAATVTALAKLATEILAWRSKMRAKKQDAKVRIQFPGQLALDFEHASDDEVRECLLSCLGRQHPTTE